MTRAAGPMSSDIPTPGDMRQVRALLANMSSPAASRLAGALDRILVGEDPATALGLKPSAGQRTALTKDRLLRRDELLRELARRHFKRMNVSEQAREIVAIWAEYQRRAARLDAATGEMPSSYIGRPRAFLFEISRLPASVPSVRTLRMVLSNGKLAMS